MESIPCASQRDGTGSHCAERASCSSCCLLLRQTPMSQLYALLYSQSTPNLLLACILIAACLQDAPRLLAGKACNNINNNNMCTQFPVSKRATTPPLSGLSAGRLSHSLILHIARISPAVYPAQAANEPAHNLLPACCLNPPHMHFQRTPGRLKEEVKRIASWGLAATSCMHVRVVALSIT